MWKPNNHCKSKNIFRKKKDCHFQIPNFPVARLKNLVVDWLRKKRSSQTLLSPVHSHSRRPAEKSLRFYFSQPRHFRWQWYQLRLLCCRLYEPLPHIQTHFPSRPSFSSTFFPDTANLFLIFFLSFSRFFFLLNQTTEPKTTTYFISNLSFVPPKEYIFFFIFETNL